MMHHTQPPTQPPNMIRIASVDVRGNLVADGCPIGERETFEVYRLKLAYGRMKDVFKGVYKP